MRYPSVVVTGGAGFIGSSIAIELKKRHPGLCVIALDNLKRRGSELNILRLREHEVDFVHGDIRCPEDLVFKKAVGLLIECSAEPAVLAGCTDNPGYIIQTNLAGTINCLELCRRHRADIIFLSTSRVYPYEAINGIPFTERATRFEWKIKGIDESFITEGPKTLYGATKHSCESLLQEYLQQYGLKGLINRCGVVAGPGQFGKADQGVFTLWVLSHYFKKPLAYIGFGGKGKQVRDFVHVDDLCELLLRQIDSLHAVSGQVYNVGGSRQNSLSLLETTALCRKITGNRIPVGSIKKARYGDVAVYISDTSKAAKAFDWRATRGAEKTLTDIYRWIRANEKDIRNSLQL